MRFWLVGLAALVMALIGVGQIRAAIFFGLGDLPGGVFQSTASGVSADGSVVVGTSEILGGLVRIVPMDSLRRHVTSWFSARFLRQQCVRRFSRRFGRGGLQHLRLGL